MIIESPEISPFVAYRLPYMDGIYTPLGASGGSGGIFVAGSGSGSPEGVVSALVGALYEDISTDPPGLWAKYSGSGNTGWRQLIG